MNKKNRLRITAAASAALLLGGAVMLFKDDISQEISRNKLEPFRPEMVSQGTLDDITDELMTEMSALTEASAITNSETPIITEEIQCVTASDVLPDDVRQSLVDSAQSLNNAYPDALGWLYMTVT